MSHLAALCAGLLSLADPQAARPAVAPTPPAAAPVPALEGTVKGPDGKPVEKALVLARPNSIDGSAAPLSARTDAQGRFRIQPPRRDLFWVLVEAPGLAPRSLPRVPLGTPLAVTLEKGGVTEGTVRDASGSAVPGARVQVLDHRDGLFGTDSAETNPGLGRTASDAKGRYRLEGLSSGEHTVTAQARGLGRATRRSVAVGTRCDLVLVAGGTVSGRVTGPGGKPVAGAAVTLTAEAERRNGGSDRTDAEGRYEASGLEPGGYRLLARHRDFAPALLRGVTVEGTGVTEADVVLVKGAQVVGRMFDEAGRPLSSGRVQLQELDGEPMLMMASPMRTDAAADGTFQIPSVPPGSHALGLTARGVTAKRVELVVGPQDERVDVGDVVLEVGLAIRGRVRDKAGQSVGDAEIRGVPMRSATGYRSVEARSDPDGSFVLAGLVPATYRLNVTARGYGGAEGEAQAGADDVQLVLERGGSVVGLVVDETGRPIDDFRALVRATRPSRESFPTPASGQGKAGGRLEVHDVAEGTHTVEVSATDRETALVSQVKVTAGAATDVGTIRLGRGGTIRGTVTDKSGVGIAEVQLRANSGRSYGSSPGGVSQTGGAFEIRGVPGGTTDVSAYHPSYVEGGVRGVEVDPAKGPTEVRIVLGRGGRLEGSARRRDGTPMAGAQVQVFQSQPRGFASTPSTVVRSDGSFVVEHAPPGRVRVSLLAQVEPGRHAGGVVREVDIREGETTRLDLTSHDILVSGRITRAGAPVPGMYVRLDGASRTTSLGQAGGPLPPGPRLLEGVSREDGTYELLADQPGRRRVTLTGADGRSDSHGRAIDIPDADAFTVDFELPSSSLTGVVVDEETERPVRAQVSASPRGRIVPRSSGATPAGGHATAQADGRFELELDPGDYRLHVTADGYVSKTVDVAVGGAEVRVALTRGLVLEGRVVDARGRPVAQESVSAIGEDGGFDIARTEADGRFRFDRLSGGRQSLLVRLRDSRGFAFRAGVSPGERDVVLTVGPGGRLRLRVLGPDNRPVADARAAVTAISGVRVSAIQAGNVSTADGLIEMDAPAGALTVEVRKGRLQVQAAVTVADAGTAEADVRFTEGLPIRRP